MPAIREFIVRVYWVEWVIGNCIRANMGMVLLHIVGRIGVGV